MREILFRGKRKDNINVKCGYCDKIVNEVGLCGVCKSCCREMLLVCNKIDYCNIGKKLKRNIIVNKRKKIYRQQVG